MSCMRLNMAEAVKSDSYSIGTAKVDQKDPPSRSICMSHLHGTDSAYKCGTIKVYVPIVELACCFSPENIDDSG